MNHSGFYIFQNKSRYPSVGGSQSYLNRKYLDFPDSSSSKKRDEIVFHHNQQEQQIIQQLLQRIQDLEQKTSVSSVGVQTEPPKLEIIAAVPEPVAAPPAAVPEPVAAAVPEPVAAPVAQPVAAPVPEPVAAPPVPEPVAAPVAQPVAAPPAAVPEPVAAPVAQPVAAPVPEPVASIVVAPVVKPLAIAPETQQIMFADNSNVVDFEFNFGETFFIKHVKPDKKYDRYIVSRNRLVPFKNNIDNPNLLGTPIFISASHELHINELNVSFTGNHGNISIVLYCYNTATERVTVLWNLVKEANRNHVYFNEERNFLELQDDTNKKILRSGTYHFYIGLTTKEAISGILNVSINMLLVKDRLRDIKRHFRNIRF